MSHSITTTRSLQSIWIALVVTAGVATGPVFGATIVEDPQITFLGAIEGNSFRYSFEFALPIGADGVAFELISHTDLIGNIVSDSFKSVQTPTIDLDATTGSNGWAITGANADSSVFYAQGSADVNFSFDVVFYGDLSDSTVWRIWFYDNSSRADAWGVLGGLEYKNFSSGGGSSPDPAEAPVFDDRSAIAVPLPSATALGLAGLIPLVLRRRRRFES